MNNYINDIIEIKEKEAKLQQIYHMVDLHSFINNEDVIQEAIINSLINAATDLRNSILTKLRVGIMDKVMDPVLRTSGSKRKTKYDEFLNLYKTFSSSKHSIASMPNIRINTDSAAVKELSTYYSDIVDKFFNQIDKFLNGSFSESDLSNRIENLHDEIRKVYSSVKQYTEKMKTKLVKTNTLSNEEIIKYIDDTASVVRNISDINSKISDETSDLGSKIQHASQRMNQSMRVKFTKGITKAFSLFNHFIVKVKFSLQYYTDLMVNRSSKLIKKSTTMKDMSFKLNN